METLCAEHRNNVIKVGDNKKPGEWVGLETEGEGKPGKEVVCRCVVVKGYGKDSQAKNVIEGFKWRKK